jgi:probable HAF family extracellular repeat protein
MNINLEKFKYSVFFLSGIYAAAIPTVVSADWSFTGLGTLGGVESFASSINDSGQIVGKSDVEFVGGGATHAFVTGPNGVGMTDLHPFELTPGSSSFATAINNSGQVTGGAWDDDHTALPSTFITGPNGAGMTDLGTFGGLTSNPSGINDSGQVVGQFYDGDYRAFITGPNGTGMTELNIPNLTPSSISGINNSGQVAGQRSYDGNYHSFITGSNGVGITELETLRGVTSSTATGINNSGQVIGYSTGYTFVTGPDGVGVTNLGSLGGLSSLAFGINDSGEIVGRSATGTESDHAFIFSHGGMTDLSLLAPVVASGWENITPIDINNNGQIVGFGKNSDGITEAFLLSYTPDTVFTPQPIYIPPVPEPETYLMLLAGLGLIGFIVRRRKEIAV